MNDHDDVALALALCAGGAHGRAGGGCERGALWYRRHLWSRTARDRHRGAPIGASQGRTRAPSFVVEAHLVVATAAVTVPIAPHLAAPKTSREKRQRQKTTSTREMPGTPRAPILLTHRRRDASRACRYTAAVAARRDVADRHHHRRVARYGRTRLVARTVIARTGLAPWSVNSRRYGVASAWYVVVTRGTNLSSFIDASPIACGPVVVTQ